MDTGVPPGDVLRFLRRRSRQRQTTLAEAAGLSQAQYSRIEAGSQPLEVDAWVPIAPLVVMGQPRDEDVIFALCAPLTSEVTPKSFFLDGAGRMALFRDLREAVRAAGLLVTAGSGRACAVPFTSFSIQDILFAIGPNVSEHYLHESLDLSDPRDLQAARVASLRFVSDAFAMAGVQPGGPGREDSFESPTTLTRARLIGYARSTDSDWNYGSNMRL